MSMASKELQAALEAARAAAEVIRSLYQRNLTVRIKADKSPVTEADVRALCLEEWKPAGERHASRERFASLIKAIPASGCGAMPSGRVIQAPSTDRQAEHAPQYGLR